MLAITTALHGASSPGPSPLSPEEHAIVARVVDNAPPLSQSAKARLAALLRPSSNDHVVDGLRRVLRGGVA